MESRIRVKVDPEFTPSRLEDRRDVNAEIKVDVDAHLRGLAFVGIIFLGLGTLAMLVGALMFALGMPDKLYDPDLKNSYVKPMTLSLGGGVIFLLFGASAFFHGRTVVGSGRLDQFTAEGVEVSR